MMKADKICVLEIYILLENAFNKVKNKIQCNKCNKKKAGEMEGWIVMEVCGK